ncbi:LOW QUALITY PROTEIN: exonuclease 1 [Drosophila gunungcola]|uniref:LOW QUALITY PROTEIN: exonuclease 1 n=1 Tax=Drosophila gunungcola TaxID=103775 RepID=UPI0022E8E4FA|nr:LOW QUALITY PROTEIN: exonuclease 1 [Drosophila gunungcola]
MGITGLIPFVEKASSRLQLKDIRGSTVAVDTYCWLHKGVFGCAEKLARGEDTDVYVQYCLKYVQMLLSYDIKPILVFDGQHLPAKALTEKRRRDSRKQSKERAAELLRLGRIEEARSHMRRCVDVTHEMALRLIRECRSRNVDCIVAPYEADAQMAWLNKTDVAHYIITEDSDLTLFGAKKIIFKLDLNGSGLLVEADKLHLAMGCKEEKYNFEKFRRMCILSGCDYLDSLPGIGLAKACKFILKTEQDDMRIALKKIPSYLNMRNLEVDDDYIENFLRAEATFKHMFIYNPLERRMQRLCALKDYETDESYCSNAGTLLEDSDQALHLALGNLNPFSLKRLDSWTPEMAWPTPKNVKRAKHKSIWQGNFQKENPSTPKKGNACALFFKKVDFVSKTVDEEIAANQKIEKAKQTEAQVFSMYNFRSKRKRSPRKEESMDQERTPPPSPVQKSRHNPFAKERTVEEASQRSPVVCENASLLRLLSPKKASPLGGEADETRVNALKRSIFAKEQVQVRSRFFASQDEQTRLQKEQPKDEQNGAKKEQELDSSSISKKLRLEKEVISVENSKRQRSNSPCSEGETDTETTASSLLQSQDNPSESTHLESQEEPATSQPEKPTKGIGIRIKSLDVLVENSLEPTDSDRNNNDAIILLSDDSCSSEQTASSISTSTLQRQNSLPAGKRRVGLSKPSTAKKGTPKTKTNGKLGVVGQNQTKLSMFGFQKRPVLK